MRVVEQQKNTTSLAYRGLQSLAVIGGVFSFVICILLITNNLSLKSSDPIHLKALEERLQEMKGDPSNEAIKLQIRELDFMARRAFFTSQHFNHMGIYFLVGGLIVTIVSYKTLEAYRQPVPYPDSSDPKDDLIDDARWARTSLTGGAFVLAGFALILALPDNSPLDKADEPAKKGSAQQTGQESSGNTSNPGKVTPLATPEQMANNWPSFRGSAHGASDANVTPISWDGESGEGIAWKTTVPLPGFSSPIYWEDRIFLTGGDKQKREVYCFDPKDG